MSNSVEESTEKLAHALHDAAKRGNIEFLQQSLANKVSFLFNRTWLSTKNFSSLLLS